MNDGTSSREDVAARLAIVRIAAGFENQNAFAERTGLGAAELNHFESGRRPLTIAAANKIRTRWRVTLDYLYHGDRSGLSVELARNLPTLAEYREKAAAEGRLGRRKVGPTRGQG